MVYNAAEVQSFLKDSGWVHCSCEALPADFSTRRFARLSREGTPATAILMQAGADQRTEAFVNLSALLRRLEIAAPEIYASDIPRGFVLMEDFGSSNVGQLLDTGADRDAYDLAAAGVLAHLHERFSQTMLGAFKTSLYNAALFSDQVTLFLDHYYPRLFQRAVTARERSGFVEAWHRVLSPLDSLPRSLLLRDFMPDNMMALEAPVLGQKVGLVDFQDAGIGSIAYDMASWCEDVRRDGGLARLPSFVEKYCALNGNTDAEQLLSAAQVYAAQRHTRILGILVKLDKLEHLPRVWRALQSLLKEKPLEPVRHWFLSCPPPRA